MWTRRSELLATSRSPGRRQNRLSHAVREYLTALDTAHSKEENGQGDDRGSSGGRRRKPPKEISLTDPHATWVAKPGMDPFFAYDASYLIDNKAGIIIDAEGTRANRVVEIFVTRTMIERVARRFGLQPRRLAGDTVYGAVSPLKWLVDRRITPHLPSADVLSKALTSLYAYTSDEKGIRHALIDDSAAKVDETDALFMFGACAAFVSYLIGKARVNGLWCPLSPQ
jgi:hypothetical protein